MKVKTMNIHICIICTKENRLPTDINFIQTLRTRFGFCLHQGSYVGFINPLMISYYDVIKKYSLFYQLRLVVF